MMNSMQEAVESSISTRLQTMAEDGTASKTLLMRLEKELNDIKVMFLCDRDINVLQRQMDKANSEE